MGGRGSSSGGGGGGGATYPRLSYAALRNSSLATAEQKKQVRDTVKRFATSAKAGDVYRTGVGVGSGSETFEIVAYRRSPNGLGIKSGARTVAMSNSNIKSWIGNGATRIKRGRGR